MSGVEGLAAVGGLSPLDQSLRMSALWRSAQESLGASSPTTSTVGGADGKSAEPAEQAQLPPEAAAAQAVAPSQPLRLSSLLADPTQLARTRPTPVQAEPEEEPEHRAAKEHRSPAHPGAAEEAEPADWRPLLLRRWQQSSLPEARLILQRAREQWALGRRVLLACPARPLPTAGEMPATQAGWAALLQGQAGPAGLSLSGPRWRVQMQWRHAAAAGRPDAGPATCLMAHAVKEAPSPGLAWQLRPSPEPGQARARIALQLGPLCEAGQRWQDLGLRLDAARAFRSALGPQWSVWLLASPEPWMCGSTDWN
ncbi:chromosomal replication initiator protein DnaA [Kinneretia aquatilis]|uniref:hypothetical protein n=1 Tax=Kinneretia aquatilis TaxID=2070761 RepID=UPI0014951A57|nr:hypothetical protein [Paucibacter aquatile]WIV98239.1 hypothetical protein K9V56_001650 [Paucibacter aquatile]